MSFLSALKHGKGRCSDRERLTLRIHRGRSAPNRHAANHRPLTSVLLAQHGPPGFGAAAVAGLGSNDIKRFSANPHHYKLNSSSTLSVIVVK